MEAQLGNRPAAAPWLFVFPNRVKSRLLHGMKFRVILSIRQSNLFPTVRRPCGSSESHSAANVPEWTRPVMYVPAWRA